jgi:hypothetical protein
MSKMFSTNRLGALLVALGFWIGISTGARAQDSFALAIGPQDHLNIFGPKGEQVAEIPIPTIAKSLTVGTTTFQISYGRDADDMLTAVLTPSSSQAQDLHFTVMGKNIDADKEAVVTLTFPDARHVTVDPGYIGVVTVNSRSIRHHELADDMYAPKPVYHASSTAPVHLTSASSSTSAPTPRLVADVTPRAVPPAAALAPAMSSPSSSDPTPASPSSSTMTSATPAQAKKLFWAEPVTPRHGTPPSVGLNEMKLVDVHGPVTVQTSDGNTMPATNGMILPSGAKVSTAADASAAVFMGGVNSARFLPNSSASVAQNFNGSVRKTSISLTKGTVFCRVGKRSGERQDYEVHTPEGVAAARGTSLAVTIAEIGGVQYTVCFTQTGDVLLTDNAGQQFDIATSSNGTTTTQIAGASVPNLSVSLEKTLLISALMTLQPFNTQLDAIGTALTTNPDSVSQADKNYYDNNPDIVSDTTQFLDSVTSTLSNLGVTSNSTTVSNGDGTNTTTTTTSGDGDTTTTSTQFNPTTGQVVGITTTTATLNPDGTTTTTTTTTDANGNTTTTTTTTTNTGGIRPPDLDDPAAPGTPPATGTLNIDANGAPELSPF